MDFSAFENHEFAREVTFLRKLHRHIDTKTDTMVVITMGSNSWEDFKTWTTVKDKLEGSAATNELTAIYDKTVPVIVDGNEGMSFYVLPNSSKQAKELSGYLPEVEKPSTKSPSPAPVAVNGDDFVPADGELSEVDQALKDAEAEITSTLGENDEA